MSSYFRSAAMTLLSKTLTTFLHKYLSEVDVDGVELPSLYYSDEQSGYGVRLSNVKLRDGVQLMELPGKKRQKKKHVQNKDSKQKQQQQQQPSSTNKQNADDLHQDDSRDVIKQKLEKKFDDNVDDNNNKDNNNKDNNNNTNNTNNANKDDSTDITAQEKYYYDSDDTVGSHHESSSSPCGPQTPTQQSSAFFCFTSSKPTSKVKGKEKSKHKDDATGDDDDENKDNKSTTNDDDYKDNETLKLSQEDSVSGQDLDNQDTTKDGKIDEDKENNNKIDNVDVDDGPRNDNDETDEDDESPFFFSDKSMVLQLGEDGRIGSLDVRFIGKDLHVLIEDACLTIEAIPKEHNQDPADTKKKAEPKKKKATPKENTTPGDRIIANNPIAKVISSIPHLFLRDIRIRFVIRGEDEENQDNNEETKKENDNKKQSESSKKNKKLDNKEEAESNRNKFPINSIIEFGIDFLSVTSGEDFLSKFQEEPHVGSSSAHQDHDDINDNSVHSIHQYHPHLSSSLQDDDNPYEDMAAQNEFLFRRIRTGKGPDGGLWLKIFPPISKKKKRRKGALSETTEETHLSTDKSNNINDTSPTMTPRWARDKYLEQTQNYFFRCSGLDINARIFLGTKVELSAAGASSSFLWSSSANNDHEISDSMLYDSIAPGASYVINNHNTHTSMNGTSLPPKQRTGGEEYGSDHTHSYENDASNNPFDVTTYLMDHNGIQSNQIKSNFHRVARGLLPTTWPNNTNNDHLPCDNSSECWEYNNNHLRQHDSNNIPTMDHPLDYSTPLPGLALSVSLTDSIELNIDRTSLEVIGMVIGLFTKQKETTNASGNENVEDGNNETASSTTAKTAESDNTNSQGQSPKSSETVTGANSDTVDGSKTTAKSDANNNESIEQNQPDGKVDETGSTTKESSVASAFPTYMKPECIQMIGVHISNVCIRIHVMESGHDNCDIGLSFCYWDFIAKCITLDMQTLSCGEEEKVVEKFGDIRLDIGLIQLHESRGTCHKELLSFGVPFTEEDILEDENSVAQYSSQNKGSSGRPWPTTVCSILEVNPPRESLIYASRERHGLQMRYINLVHHRCAGASSSSNAEEKLRNSRTIINVRLGVTSLDLAFAVKDQINTVKDEVKICLFGPKKKDAEEEEKKDTKEQSDDKDKQSDETEKIEPVQSMMKYSVQIDGGRIKLYPLVDINLPLTRFSGEKSSDAGMFFQTILNHVELKYGTLPSSSSSVVSSDGLSVVKMAELPESVRMRILLFLEDLSPLEKALGVKTPESNSFFACRAVNKRFVRLAKKVTKSMNKSHASSASIQKLASSSSRATPGTTGRRQKIMTEILKLDDDALEAMWMTHKKNQKKRGKKKKGTQPPPSG